MKIHPYRGRPTITRLAELIQALQLASEGSEELDLLALKYYRRNWADSGIRLHFTRSLDAKFPDEVVVRVEKITRRISVRWRAWLDNGWSADADTEILARRLAWLTYEESEKRRKNPEPRKPPRDDKQYKRMYAKRVATDEDAQFDEPLITKRGKTNDKLIIEILCTHIRRLQRREPVVGTPTDFPDSSTGDMTIRAIRHADFQPSSKPAADDAGILFSEGIEAWRLESRPTVKNLDRVQRAGRRFIEMYGDRPMNHYIKAEVREFLSHLRKVPKWPHFKLRNMPMPVILKYSEDNPSLARITPRTVRAYLKDLQLLFNWAQSMDLCATNPANNLRVIDRRHQSETRAAYDIEDLKLIFERSPIYHGSKAAHARRVPGDKIFKDSLFWFPLMALLTGARQGELAQAIVDDIRTESGIPYLDIHAGGDNRHLKTQSSDRRIPIHPELVKMGFLDFVSERKANGGIKVFEEVAGRRNIRTNQGWSQAWRVYQFGIGLDDRRKVFHSFRHTFKRACRDAGIEEEIHDTITGHRAYWSGRRYGQGVSLQMASNAMARVKYQGLDLSHLYEVG